MVTDVLHNEKIKTIMSSDQVTIINMAAFIINH